jgi:hypothetical protein
MHPHSPRDPVTSPRRGAATMLTDVFLFLLILRLLSPDPASAQLLPHGEPLLRGMVHSSSPSLLAISGEGFSSGGPVLIAITGSAGTDARFETWTFASSHDSWGPFGAGAANLEFIPAGRVRDLIPLEVEPTYGPNGSQDPALGYEPADGLAALRLALCSQGLDVQAFDARSRTWSNNLHMSAVC